MSSLQADKTRKSQYERKRCYDNILVERLWRTVNYEEVSPRAYSTGREVEISLACLL